MGRVLAIVITLVAIIIGNTLGRNYPGVTLQIIIAYVAYWLGKKVINKLLKPEHTKDKSREKTIYILSSLGLIGLLSPVIGFILSLPAFLIATDIITPKSKSKNKLIIISSIIMTLCLLNAAWGAIIVQNKY